METSQQYANNVPQNTLTLATLSQGGAILYVLLAGDWSRLDGAKYTEKQAYEESCLGVKLKPEVVEAAHLLGVFDDIFELAVKSKCVLFGVRSEPLPDGVESQDICKTILTKRGKVSLYKDSVPFRIGKTTSNSIYCTAVASTSIENLISAVQKQNAILKTVTVKGE